MQMVNELITKNFSLLSMICFFLLPHPGTYQPVKLLVFILLLWTGLHYLLFYMDELKGSYSLLGCYLSFDKRVIQIIMFTSSVRLLIAGESSNAWKFHNLLYASICRYLAWLDFFSINPQITRNIYMDIFGVTYVLSLLSGGK